MKKFFILFFATIFSAVSFSQLGKPILGYHNAPKTIHYEKCLSQKNTFEAISKKLNKKPDFISELTANRIDSALSISSFDTVLLRFTYNNNGNVTSFFMYAKESGKWANSDRFYYLYGSNGKKSLQSHEIWEDGVWNKDERTTYTYDTKGNLLTELLEKGDTSGWVVSEQSINTYNSMNLKTSSVAQKWNGTGWDNLDRVLYQYNSAGQRTVERYEDWKGEWKPTSETSYSYTDWGEYAELITTDYSNMGIKYRLSYEYNSNRQIVTETNATLDGGWQITSKTSHTYEANNTVHNYIAQYRQNGSMVNSKKGVDTLLANGNLFCSYVSSWENESWVLKERYYFTYNSAGKVLTYIIDRYYSDSVTVKVENTYDASGELLQAYHCSAWFNGVPGRGDNFYLLGVDIEAECIVFLFCKDLYLWYKNITIPVELTSLTAVPQDGNVKISWQTATETNNKGFDVERKTAENQWVKIGYVKGSGTTAESHNYSFIDKNSTTEKCYYRLKQVDFDGTVNYSQVIEVSSNVIKSYSLGQNYPNPFNPSTSISFAVPAESRVSLKIYNSVGQQVKELVSGVKPAGRYDVRFDASMMSSGVYFYTIEASAVNGTDSFRNTKKMILVK